MIIRGTNLLKLRKEDNDFQLKHSRWQGVSHFNTREFRCKHCGELNLLHYDLVLALEKLRREIGKPLTITSGYRCPEHNAKINGVKNSAHTRGYAADIAVPHGFTMKLFRDVIWKTKGLTGIKRVGAYDGYQGKHGFCHVGIKAKWVGVSHLAPRWGNWED